MILNSRRQIEQRGYLLGQFFQRKVRLKILNIVAVLQLVGISLAWAHNFQTLKSSNSFLTFTLL